MAYPRRRIARHRKGVRPRRRHHRRGGAKGMKLTRAKLMKVLRPELKYVSSNVVDDYFNARIASSSEAYPLLPALKIGTNDCQRIGTKVSPKYLQVRVSIVNTSGANAASANSIEARALCLSQKNIKFTPQVRSSFGFDRLLDDRTVDAFTGNATSTSRTYLGDAGAAGVNDWDNQAQINKDLFRVYHDRKLKFHGQQPSGVGGATWSMLDEAKTMVWKIKCPTLTYDSNTSAEFPTNFAPFFCLGWIYSSLRPSNNINFSPINVKIQSTLYYYDI
jgi:hypothetical protein